MGDVFALQDIDAFLINPTASMMTKEVQPSRRPSAENAVPAYLADYYMNWHDTPQKSAASTLLDRDLQQKYIFPREYASEEEAASPTDNDGSGFGFSSSDAESLHSAEDAEILDATHSTHSRELCARAQTVRFVSAGRPKVISVSRSSSLLSSPSSFNDEIDNGRVIFGSSKTLERARMASDERTRASSTSSSEASKPLERRPARRKANPPRLDAAPTSAPPLLKRSQTSLADQRAGLVRQDPFPADWPLPSPASPTPSTKRRMQKFSTSFSIFNNPRRTGSTASASSEESASNDNNAYRIGMRTVPLIPTGPIPTPSSIPHSIASSSSSHQPRMKMTPRGANERERTIALPPYPHSYYHLDYGYNDNDDDDSWPLRNDNANQSNTMKQIRRKSVSAAFAAAQV